MNSLPPKQRTRGRVHLRPLLLILAGGLNSIELICRFQDSMDSPPLRPPGQCIVFHPDSRQMADVSATATFRWNSLGIRGPEPAADLSIPRIVILGGGSAECPYLDDSENWPALLANDLKARLDSEVWLGNAGMGDFASAQVAQLLRDTAWIQKVDLVVCQIGSNDLLRILLDVPRAIPPIPHGSSLVRRLSRWVSRSERAPVFWDDTGEEWMAKRRSLSFSDRPVDWNKELADFGKRVQAIIAICEQRQIPVAFMTTPVLWSEEMSDAAQMKSCFLRPGIPADQMVFHMDQLHQRLQVVCEEYRKPFISCEAISGSENWFIDDLHLNREGARELVNIVADQVALIIRGSAHEHDE